MRPRSSWVMPASWRSCSSLTRTSSTMPCSRSCRSSPLILTSPLRSVMLAGPHGATATCLIPSMLSVAKLLNKKEMTDETAIQVEQWTRNETISCTPTVRPLRSALLCWRSLWLLGLQGTLQTEICCCPWDMLQQLSHFESTAGSWQGLLSSQGAVLVGACHGDVWLCGQGCSP